MISVEDIKKIEDAVDFVALVSEYVTLEKSGKNFKGICPFHDDSNPSFSVSEEKKIAKCMVCGEGGKPINFLSKIKGISFVQAAKELSERVNIKLDVDIKVKDVKDYSNYYKIMQMSFDLYNRNLHSTESGKVALDYLNKRGLNSEIIKTFGIGLSPSTSNILYNVLKDSDIMELDMLDLGLVNKAANKYFDVFSKRVIFSIKNENGNIIAFSGRTYLDNTSANEAKYVNSKETPIFVKGDCLYNLNNALIDIRRKNRVILYEGFMDVIASYKAGIKEAVCSMGTALTINQAKLIKKHTSNVIVCYDSDKAGINASFKAIDVLKQVGLNVKLVLLPNNLDPDDYINKYSIEEYYDYFNSNIIDPLEYEYKIITKDLNLNDIVVVNEVKDKVFKVINKTNSLTIMESYLKKLANDINISFESLKIDYENNYNKQLVSKSVEKKKLVRSMDDFIPFDDSYIPPMDNFIPPMNDFIPFDDDFIPPMDNMDIHHYPLPMEVNEFIKKEYPSKPKVDKDIKSYNASNDNFDGILTADTKCILRLLKYAAESKEKAHKIDSSISLSGLSVAYKKMWLLLIDNFYSTYDTYNQDVFFNMLANEDKKLITLDLTKENELDKNNYSDQDLEYCLNTLTTIGLKKDINELTDKINNISDALEKQRLIQDKHTLLKKIRMYDSTNPKRR